MGRMGMDAWDEGGTALKADCGCDICASIILPPLPGSGTVVAVLLTTRCCDMTCPLAVLWRFMVMCGADAVLPLG